MILAKLRVENLRCIKGETITCGELTAFVGSNGAGKSAFLKAIDLFYSTSPQYSVEDFYNNETKEPIKITITYSGLDGTEKEHFKKYIQKDELSVMRVLNFEEERRTDSYHGSILQNPDFVPLRQAAAKQMKELYLQLQGTEKYGNLPKWTKQDDGLKSLAAWEDEHPQDCKRIPDDGKFFGFKAVAQGYLGRYTRYLHIPAVRDAADDAAEGKGSIITQLMDLVVRSVLENRADVKAFRDEMQQRYTQIFDPSNLTEIGGLEAALSTTLKNFVPDSGVELEWLTFSNLELPLPKAEISLIEDEYAGAVERTGHGLQRAFIMTLLQHLVMAQAQSTAGAEQEGAPGGGAARKAPNLILGIEEPELYQHPDRQRHLANILHRLAHGQIPGVAEHTQVIYCTHSPLFVGTDRFNEIRLVRKVSVGNGVPKVSSVTSNTLDEVAAVIWEANGRPAQKYTGETLKPHLATLLNPWMSEGFFAATVVLVEGDSDRAALIAAAHLKHKRLESLGVSIIPCAGKSNMYRAAAIFRAFRIPVFCMWDSDAHLGETAGVCEKCRKPLDRKANPEENKRLLRLLGRPDEDWPEYVDVTSACFKSDREAAMKAEIGGQLFEDLLRKQMTQLGFQKRDHALKNTLVVENVLEAAQKQGRKSATLEAIVDRIIALREVKTIAAAQK